jgi:hypothetical protein
LVEPVQDGRIHIEKINWPMLQGTGAEDAPFVLLPVRGRGQRRPRT